MTGPKLDPEKSMPNSILVTGSNRGIGLALTRQLLLRGHRVIATCRQAEAASELRESEVPAGAELDIQLLELTSESSVTALATHIHLKYSALDVLVNNAGVLIDRENHSLLDLDWQQLADTLETNLLGTMRVTRALWPLLQSGTNSRVINISSGAGLISTKGNSRHYAYSISKAALNMFTRMLEIEGRQQSICVVAVIPGRVQTRMTNNVAPQSPLETAQCLADMIERLKMADSGAVLDRHGKRCFDGIFKDAEGRVCHVGW
jgi:NAD(P)-dependent dehydrogenase (short-subunit alcohol dehydrogenase family)